MYREIASSLFQKKSCLLPGIGVLELNTVPAEPDFLNSRINAPVQMISFKASTDAGYNEFSGISSVLQNEIQLKGSVDIPGLGKFSKEDNGVLQFTAVNVPTVFIQPVAANRVIHKNAEHTILVGDKEFTNTAMTEYYTDTAVVADRWWIWALVIAVAGIAGLIYYLSQYGYNDLSSLSIW